MRRRTSLVSRQIAVAVALTAVVAGLLISSLLTPATDRYTVGQATQTERRP